MSKQDSMEKIEKCKKEIEDILEKYNCYLKCTDPYESVILKLAGIDRGIYMDD